MRNFIRIFSSYVRFFTGEALGAIGDISVIPILEEYSKDPVVEVAETCQLALNRLNWLSESKNTSQDLSKNPYASVDPAPPAAFDDIDKLKEILLNEKASLFDRYRAMFSLRNLRSDESVVALAEGEKYRCFIKTKIWFSMLTMLSNKRRILINRFEIRQRVIQTRDRFCTRATARRNFCSLSRRVARR